MVCIYVDPHVWEALQSQRSSAASPGIRDICGGKELEPFTSQGNLTLVMNTDGVQLFKSSTVSMWPIWIMINELPVTLR